jgi:hypothetical protein
MGKSRRCVNALNYNQRPLDKALEAEQLDHNAYDRVHQAQQSGLPDAICQNPHVLMSQQSTALDYVERIERKRQFQYDRRYDAHRDAQACG